MEIRTLKRAGYFVPGGRDSGAKATASAIWTAMRPDRFPQLSGPIPTP
jgi:hypothetical protein